MKIGRKDYWNITNKRRTNTILWFNSHLNFVLNKTAIGKIGDRDNAVKNAGGSKNVARSFHEIIVN